MSLKIKALGRATVNLTNGQAIAVYSQTVPVQVWLQNQPVNRAPTLSLVAISAPGTQTVYGPVTGAQTVVVIAGNDDTYYEMGTLPIVKQWLNEGNGFMQSGTPNAVNATATLTTAQLLGGLITSSTVAAVVATLPTGTIMDAGSSWAVGEFVDLAVTNSGANTWTLTAAATFTIVGSAVVAATGAAAGFGIFRLVKQAANTFVAYRIG
jgi:hypothetical protein